MCVDLDHWDHNVRQMTSVFRQHGVQWRPHAKCFKSRAIARRLIAAGAIGLTCAKLGEAEVFVDADIDDLLIANIIVGRQKLRRLAELAQRARPIVCFDHLDQVRPISEAAQAVGVHVRILIEIDLGLKRVGVEPGAAVVQLAEQAANLPGVQFAGVMGYEGHLLTIQDPRQKELQILAASPHLQQAKQDLLQVGLPCDIVSCGGTGSYTIAARAPAVTEIQAGGGLFMDAFYAAKCQVAQHRHALTVLATVVSRPAAHRAVIDAGRKTLNSEVEKARVLVGGCTIDYLSAEHGCLTLSDPSDLSLGDRIELIPGYADLTTVLHDRIFALRNDVVEEVWPLEARGNNQ